MGACAKAGVHYSDLSGETFWQREMVQAWSASAEASGAKIVLGGGVDSIPSDLGAYLALAALNALPATAGLEFARLKKLTGATDGNLGAHIETLAKAGYVSVEKAFVGKKPQTTVTATAAGRGAFARHVATLQEIIAGRQG